MRPQKPPCRPPIRSARSPILDSDSMRRERRNDVLLVVLGVSLFWLAVIAGAIVVGGRLWL